MKFMKVMHNIVNFYYDNQNVLWLTMNGKIRHIKIKYFFIQEDAIWYNYTNEY